MQQCCHDQWLFSVLAFFTFFLSLTVEKRQKIPRLYPHTTHIRVKFSYQLLKNNNAKNPHLNQRERKHHLDPNSAALMVTRTKKREHSEAGERTFGMGAIAITPWNYGKTLLPLMKESSRLNSHKGGINNTFDGFVFFCFKFCCACSWLWCFCILIKDVWPEVNVWKVFFLVAVLLWINPVLEFPCTSG